ncbi:MAG: TIGR03435 family protein, partial [Acidobacteriota bacterium]
YARALAGLESERLAELKTVMAATGGSLAHRVGRLLGQSRPGPRTLSGPAIVAAGSLVIVAFSMFGQPVARIDFEVASIKPFNGPSGMMVRPLARGLAANAPVRMLIGNAYAVQPYQIVGGPDWSGSQRYQIEANAQRDSTKAEVFLMLQSLLKDRFKLTIHRETRELPVYNLVPARGGLKLSGPQEGRCVEDPETPPQRIEGRMTPPADGPLPAARCGSINIVLAAEGARLQGGKILMPEFIRMLSMALGRPVVDKTGFTGPFDVRLDFLPDDITAAMPPPPPGAIPNPGNASIVVALQEQLGLRLDSAKGPVDIIVIDHVEQPSAN